MKKIILTITLLFAAGCSANTDDSVSQNAAPEQVTAEQTAPPDMDYLCTPQETVTPICGFVGAPEDAEWLPDGSGLIVSEMTGFALTERRGAISLLDVETGEISVLHEASRQNSAEDKNVWGAEGVTSKEQFSPHGINLSKRGDGRWQLLVVNHAEIETIDIFELLQVDGQWALQWRGGVDADGTDFYNDVSAFEGGFYTTRFIKGGLMNLYKDYAAKLENGIVKKWTRHAGWAELAGTKGVSLNGILWNEAADELVVAEWGADKVNVFSGTGVHKYTIDDVPNPDNVSWNEAKDAYLIASKKSGLQKITKCGAVNAEVCEGEFTIFEVEPGTGEKTVRYHSDGKFWGPPSNAVERDGKLYIGSFGGSRILVVE